EFAVLLRGCDLADAKRVGEAIASDICAIPIQLAGRPHVVSASIGIVSLSPGMDADTALVSADAACYAAKNTGRSRIVVA
ncbi:GGDEF domain-containing protein, partial [Devosia nitrariae]|uniref:GGDEF domain-containing protein n=2 Tax=Devosia nitrariae TaxID=2071872 RepID=UPI0035E95EFC